MISSGKILLGQIPQRSFTQPRLVGCKNLFGETLFGSVPRTAHSSWPKRFRNPSSTLTRPQGNLGFCRISLRGSTTQTIPIMVLREFYNGGVYGPSV